MATDKLAAELAFKANVDAVSRDYICEPHLGVYAVPGRDRSSASSCCKPLQYAESVPLVMQSTGPYLVSVDRWWLQRA